MLTLTGLKTCDSCRKARKALEAAGQQVTFVDLRVSPPDAARWQALLVRFGDRLLNRASTTWRGLSEAERAQDPVALLSAHPSLMKRPLIEADDGRASLGWTAQTREEWGVTD